MNVTVEKPSRFQWGIRVVSGLAVAAAASLYFVQVPGHPPGFSIDESSICYNAWTIAQTGHDEYGRQWPLFFRAFGEYKSPTIVYILAGLFRLAGPGIAAARMLVASCGVLTALLLGLLAWRVTRRWIVATIVAGTTLLTPWLFESSRLVFEVALYPALLGLFLLALWRARRQSRWKWSDVFMVAISLAGLTYSYSIGRLLAPLLAVGLILFASRQRWSGIVTTWIFYALLCVPLFLFQRQNPEALTGRFKALTYLAPENSALTNVREFARHYLQNVNPWRWLLTGENNVRDHVEGTGSLLFATVVLAIAGAVIVLRNHRRDPWWRFVLYGLLVSVVPASLTSNPFPQLRLIAFPVFFLLLIIPALQWFVEPLLSPAKRVAQMTAIVLIAGQGLVFQRLYHQKAPGLWYVFDARFPNKILRPALTSPQRPIYLLDEPGKAGYIHALWYGVINHLDPATFVRLPWGKAAPPGVVLISTEEKCHECQVMARALNYIVYSVPPYLSQPTATKEPLSAFAAEIVSENALAVMTVGQKNELSFLIKNISSAEWPCVSGPDNNHAVSFQTRWTPETGIDGATVDVEKELPYDTEPGDTVGLTLSVTAPSKPGRYYLEADLVQKGVARFGERGSTPFKRAVEIVP